MSGPLDKPAAASGRPTRAQRLIGLIFVGAGVNHFVLPRPYQQIVPPSFGDPARLVAISGVAEIAGGVGVLLPGTRRLAGLGLIALLVAVFPANVYMARNPARFARIPGWALYARLPLQPLMMWWVWRATRKQSIAVDGRPATD
ncbi:MAG TPA: DoxX family protein [Solirubrobacteraceae bacterium]|jgi:uncharacterized membrane protein